MTMLKVSHLTKKYGAKKGIFDFDLTMNNKDIVLLLGPNGAGKTTAVRGILGLTQVSMDNILLNDTKIDQTSMDFLKSIGAMVSKPVFYDYLSGQENLELYKKIYKTVDSNRISEVLDYVDLQDAKDDKVSTYSTGMKQRLDFARAIMHKPSILLLDEPFSGMDIEKKAELKNLINYLQKEMDLSVLISSHMVGDLENFANRVIILYEGVTLFEGTMEEVKKRQPSLEAFYLATINNYKGVKGGTLPWKSLA